jgi:L-ascorbate metabolism protein UlaG (beta-lactamase superfamily)
MPRFRNLDPFEQKGARDMFKWKIVDTLLGRRRADRGVSYQTPRVDNDGSALAEKSPSLTWVGHSTFLLRLGGLLVATDPIWAERLGPVTKRNVAPGVAIERMPPVDVVTISHAHYDHLDMPTLLRLDAHARAISGRSPLFLVPSEVGRYLRAGGLTTIVERAWWEHHEVGDVRFTLVPQQHWSMRTPLDRDEALWGGWVMQSSEGVAYHAGDTGYFRHFGEIGARVGSIDWAMLPIGAYDPQWLMQPQHMGPEEAGRAFVELGARNLVCMHWGTFPLTDEPLGEPAERIARWWDDVGPGASQRERLWRLAIGETRALSK